MSLFIYFNFSILFGKILFFSSYLGNLLFAYSFVWFSFRFCFVKDQWHPHSQHLSFIETLWYKQHSHPNNTITKGPCNPEQRGLWLLTRGNRRVRSLETQTARECPRVTSVGWLTFLSPNIHAMCMQFEDQKRTPVQALWKMKKAGLGEPFQTLPNFN